MVTPVLLADALLLADHASPAPVQAQQALRTLRAAYLELSVARSMFFPAEMTTADHATALSILAGGRKTIIGVGQCSLSIDPVAGVIWGFNQHGQVCVAGPGLDATAASTAISWALTQHLATGTN